MNKLNRIMTGMLVAAASLTMTVGAMAQGNTSSMYVPGSGYVGLTAGTSDYSLDNGFNRFSSDLKDNAYGIQIGAYANNNFGLELGYTDFGTISRGGGSTNADGFNISVIGKFPLTPAFNLLGKIGTTYSRTDVSAVAGSGVVSGSEDGFGLSYGLGVEYTFTPQWSAALQYDSHDMTFAGDRDDRVAVTSLGVRYRF